MCVGTTKHTQPTARVVPTSGRHMNRTSGLVALGARYSTSPHCSRRSAPTDQAHVTTRLHSSETSLGNSRAMLMYIKEHQNSHVDCFRLRLYKPSKPMSQLDRTRLKLASAILVILMYMKERQNSQVDSRQHRLSTRVQIYGPQHMCVGTTKHNPRLESSPRLGDT